VHGEHGQQQKQASQVLSPATEPHGPKIDAQQIATPLPAIGPEQPKHCPDIQLPQNALLQAEQPTHSLHHVAPQQQQQPISFRP
jgi:hypothetical protein